MELNYEQIEALISLGYELHVHDKIGSYPGGVSRDEWEQSEKEKILNSSTSQPAVQADAKCLCKQPHIAIVGKEFCPYCDRNLRTA